MPTPKTPPTRRPPAQVRALLLEAAAHEFAVKGYNGATKKEIAERAGVALSVLDRHFDSLATLFADAVLMPFVELLERTSTNWLRQRDDPMQDEPLMRMVIEDMHESLSAHQDAIQGLTVARGDLDDEIVERLRLAFDDLVRQLRLMAELEAERRGWFSPVGLELTLRVLMAMVLGTTAYDWLLLPAEGPEPRELVEEMSQVALWGIARQPPRTGSVN